MLWLVYAYTYALRTRLEDEEQDVGRGDERHPGQDRPDHASNRSRQEMCMPTVPASPAKRGLQCKQYIGPV